MIGPDADEAVLAYLREKGPGVYSVKTLAQEAGLARVTVRTAIVSLDNQGLICTAQWVGDWGTGLYEVRHLHAGPGMCGKSLAEIVQEPPAIPQ